MLSLIIIFQTQIQNDLQQHHIPVSGKAFYYLVASLFSGAL
jgi:hypothetical protein